MGSLWNHFTHDSSRHFHISKGEYESGVNAFIMALTAFIAWGRRKKAPIIAQLNSPRMTTNYFKQLHD